MFFGFQPHDYSHAKLSNVNPPTARSHPCRLQLTMNGSKYLPRNNASKSRTKLDLQRCWFERQQLGKLCSFQGSNIGTTTQRCSILSCGIPNQNKKWSNCLRWCSLTSPSYNIINDPLSQVSKITQWTMSVAPQREATIFLRVKILHSCNSSKRYFSLLVPSFS